MDHLLATLSPISIHALREEGDRFPGLVGHLHVLFLSTPSARRATAAALPASTSTTNFYPRPPRGGRLLPGELSGDTNTISIHALREEGDMFWPSCGLAKGRFLSTPSARRATRFSRQAVMFGSNFYPRPPRGGRRGASCCTRPPQGISIHALREEGDYLVPQFIAHNA